MAATGREVSIEDLLRQSPSIPQRDTSDLVCCCGRIDCAYLLHNNVALDDLEKNIHTAAQLGQALLVRHEAYMADAEKDRMEMSLKIEKLEIDKRELEAENAKAIEDNRGLLDQLEGMNNTVADSESHVRSLEATLHATQQELRRLDMMASRTHELEMQLALLEQEQVSLQMTVVKTEAEERSAIQRWKNAERGLYDMQEQLEKIEQEAREERERHVEVVGRMERQRTVEKELDTAAGRLKGAAAATSLGQGKNGSNVVSHFVKDILQDNANLQMGIVELREMLMNSNDEVQTLRQQLMLHQPMEHGDDTRSSHSTLRAELDSKEPVDTKPTQVVSQELHIHHHYHSTPKKEEMRRPKKKRNVINPSLFTPPRSHHPRMQLTPPSTAGAILSQTSISIPPPENPNNRWSMSTGHTASDFASSAPSSPQSAYRNSGLFDRSYLDQHLDSSRPTSPGSSVDPMSPSFQPYNRKRASDQSMRSLAPPTSFQPGNIILEEGDDDLDNIPSLHSTSDTTSRDDSEQELPSESEPFSDPSSAGMSGDPDAEDFFSSVAFQPSLRRSASHESILSISGIDIHTLKSRPSQLTITSTYRPNALLRPRTRIGASTSKSSVLAEPITSSSFVTGAGTAYPALKRTGHDSTTYLRSTMGMSTTLIPPERPTSRSSSSSGDSGLGKKVGGWVWGKWGVSPSPTPASTTPQAIRPTPIQSLSKALAQSQPLTSKPSTPLVMPRAASATIPVTTRKTVAKAPIEVDPLRSFMGRPPGINQLGPVPGFLKERIAKTPSKVTPDVVDTEALREILAE